MSEYFGEHRLICDWFGFWDSHIDGYPGNRVAIYKKNSQLATLYYLGTHKEHFVSNWDWKLIQRRKRGRGLF